MRRSVYVRLFLSVLLALTAVAASVPSTPAQPKTQDDIAERLEEIARLREELERREAAVRGSITQDAERREILTEELSELQAIVDEVQSRVDVASTTLAGIEARVDEKDAAIRKAQSSLDRTLDDLSERAVHMYKHGPASVFEIVIGTSGFGDLLKRFAYMTHIVRVDNRRVEEIETVKALIVRDREEISKLRDRAAAQVAVVSAERNRAATIRNDVAARRSAVAGELQQSYAELGDIAAQRAQYDKETAELQAESAAIAAFLRGRGGGPAEVSPKGMAWPTSGPVTSGYGWRTHPIFGTRRFHAGIDIGAPSGTAITAAGSGTVVYAAAKSGYGNTVIIDHGGGIATLYGHMSAIGVGNGTRVAIGQRVGGVGCTGYCTGPHLHFEVRVNGEPVNPMGWLP